MNSVTVTIGGKDYNLRGDEEKTRRAAGEVNTVLQTLQQRMGDQSTATLSVLSALNIAEKYHDSHDQHNADMQYLMQEFSSMTEYLESIQPIDTMSASG
ncbi:MAG: cell division protein ZapA [Candidatus Kapabacteria bacterium]|nr:cell division protein ZapA [Candidatus Kapabacteria bacterium]